MATVDKNFRIKNGLIVEGTTATINGNDILAQNQASDTYIINLIGGTATSANEANTVVKRDSNGDFAAGTVSVGAITLNGTDLNTRLNGMDQDAQDYADTAESNANSYTDSAISTEVTNRNSAISTAKGEAISSSNSYTDSAISTEVTNRNNAIADALDTAESYTDSSISTEITNRNNAIATAKSEAISSSNGYTDDAISQEVSDRDSAISTAITNLNLAGTYDALGAAATALSDANSYTDGKVADLVDSAPALLDTLNELAAAIADNPNYASDVANLVATKADTTYVDSEISGVDSAAQGYANAAQAAAEATASADATSKADAAQAAAEDYADNLINDASSSSTEVWSAYKTGTEIGLAQAAAEATASADATSKADAAQAAAEATAQAALDDVLDGTTPFTDININDYAKQVAARTTSLGSVIVTAYQFNKSAFKSGKFLVKIDNGTHNEISEILVTLDSSDNVAITEYAIVGTNGSRGTITADVDATHCRIRVNPVNDSTITVSGTVFKS